MYYWIFWVLFSSEFFVGFWGGGRGEGLMWNRAWGLKDERGVFCRIFFWFCVGRIVLLCVLFLLGGGMRITNI